MLKKMNKWRKMISLCLSIVLACGVIYYQNVSVSAASTGVVTATSLNVRSGPSTSYSVVVGIKKDTKVTISSEVKDTSGTIWYKISVTVDGKSYSGYVSSAYIQKTNTSTSTSATTSSFVRRTGYVNATSLNIRKTRSTTGTIVGNIIKSKVVNVLGKSTVSEKTWYQISTTINGKTVTGYVISSYITLHPTTVSATTYSLAKTNAADTGLYLTANIYDKKRAVLKKSHYVIVRGKLTVNSVDFTLVTAIVNGKGMNGYIKSSLLTSVRSTISSTTDYAAKTNAATSAKKIAASISTSVGSLTKGQNVKVKGELTVSGTKWYRCTFTASGTTVTGYIKASCVDIRDDAEFQEELEQFPSSYQSALKTLHEKYPNWHFKAIHTGLDWETVIKNQSTVGKNTIQSNQPKGGSAGTYSAPFSYLSTEIGAYNWSNDKYTLCDGSNWYTAHSDVIKYYMDPRNSLTENLIFQFESLGYDKRQKSSVVDSILSNTFMKGNYSVTDKLTNKVVSGGYTDAFMTAGKTNNVSPYFLAIRSKQELGVNGSGSVTGNYTGYTGYYNYYNIGAADSSTGGAIANGLKWASTGTTYQRPWTNPLKAIIGGAEYIAAGYISKGQNSLYLQKFNVVYAPYYSHQYMTNVQAPNSESKSTFNSYSAMNIESDAFVFAIPVYKNMPGTACSLPKSAGNPNSYLKSLTVKAGSKTLSLTPTFNYLTKSYTMVVDNSINEVTVSAGKISTYASITGTGTYSLTAGSTKTISIVCTAGNGTKTTYTLKVSRKSS